ncbi:flagellar hook-length control protein FliK [Hoeflea sp.]|uniref:flagellar hook-length control protein FliK n=1 Tax=Hoeflea sp. TaxID=1940281 RepID=UPI00199BE2F3|nr:flagellar hook-length control protein FliK [Hoeflea sp.]MBC7280334.1 flagellar hook-length control protein FliK [Hoeflea sp.]
MSSAAFADDTDSGAGDATPADISAPPSGESIEPDAAVDTTLSALPETVHLPAEGEGIAVKALDAAETGESVNPVTQAETDQSEPPAQLDPEEHGNLDPVKGAAPSSAPATQAVITPALAAGQVSSASASLAAAQNGGSGRTPQGAPAPAKPQPATASADQGKVSGEDKEIIRTLGMVDKPSAASDSKNTGADEDAAGSRRQAAAVARAPEEQMSVRTGSVEVIESRRFMPAQALSGNAQMVTRSLIEAGDAALATQRAMPSQAATAAQPQSGQMLHTLKLQLNPVALGSVTAVLKLTGEELSVSIQVESAEAYRQLSDDNQSILKAMRAQGYAVEQITVQHVPSGDRSGNAAQQQGFQGNFQGSGSGDAQSSDRGNDGRSTGQQEANQREGHGREQKPHTGSGSGRSDGVYL